MFSINYGDVLHCAHETGDSVFCFAPKKKKVSVCVFLYIIYSHVYDMHIDPNKWPQIAKICIQYSRFCHYVGCVNISGKVGSANGYSGIGEKGMIRNRKLR